MEVSHQEGGLRVLRLTLEPLCYRAGSILNVIPGSLRRLFDGIGFDASDCPKCMASAEQLPLLVSPTISNVQLYHALIDGGATLNLISLAAFKKLQIPMGKLQPSCPFSRVGPVSVTSRSCISLPVTFGTAENFHMERVLFEVAEVDLPFSAILGRPTLYQFMAVAHYGYLVLKMPSPNGVLRIQGDRDTGACALEKL
jgi:hypothetical protein